MGESMNFSNDVLLILLLSILSSPTDENGEVEYASNTNFLLLLLLVLNNSRAVENLCNYGTCNPSPCNSCSGSNNFITI